MRISEMLVIRSQLSSRKNEPVYLAEVCQTYRMADLLLGGAMTGLSYLRLLTRAQVDRSR
jgi:hypothetical protein